MKIERFVGLLSVAALLLAAATMVAHAGDKVMVGDFVKMIAEEKGLPAGTPVQAESSLRAAGYQLPGLDLGAVLTEGDVVGISKGIGINVTTSTPDKEFDRQSTDAYLSSLGGGSLGTKDPVPDPGNETEGHPNPGTNKGKGKKKGHFKSPSEPE